MRAEILSIGNEVLSGRTLDTNFHFLARLLEESGARIVGHQAVADDERAIAAALETAFARADLVVTTGGLGPTPDDLTVEAVAKALGLGVERDPRVVEQVRRRWAAFSRRPMPANNERQAEIPAGAQVWVNPVGSAPGILVMHAGKELILLPGIPTEAEALARDFVAPHVRAKSGTAVEYLQIRTTGIAESVLEERLGDLGARLSGAWVAYLPSLGGVDLRIALPSGDATARREIEQTARAFVTERAGEYVYAVGERSLEETIGALLIEQGLSVAVAESCTGGLLGARITAVAGSSAYFEGGIVCYSNRAKVALLGVSPATLEAHGAVSEEVARELARGAVERFGARSGLSITGIAGPSGGTPDKPVGTVHVAAVTPDGESHRLLGLRGTREMIRLRSVTVALDLLRRRLLGLPAVSAESIGAPREPS